MPRFFPDKKIKEHKKLRTRARIRDQGLGRGRLGQRGADVQAGRAVRRQIADRGRLGDVDADGQDGLRREKVPRVRQMRDGRAEGQQQVAGGLDEIGAEGEERGDQPVHEGAHGPPEGAQGACWCTAHATRPERATRTRGCICARATSRGWCSRAPCWSCPSRSSIRGPRWGGRVGVGARGSAGLCLSHRRQFHRQHFRAGVCQEQEVPELSLSYNVTMQHSQDGVLSGGGRR
jgi:hypothetical protein